MRSDQEPIILTYGADPWLDYAKMQAIIRIALDRYEKDELDNLHQYLLTEYDREVILNADYLVLTIHQAVQDLDRTKIGGDGNGFCRFCGLKLGYDDDKYCSWEHELECLRQLDEEVAVSNRSATEVVEWAMQDSLVIPSTPADCRRDVLIAENRRLDGEVEKCAAAIMNAIYPNPREDEGKGSEKNHIVP